MKHKKQVLGLIIFLISGLPAIKAQSIYVNTKTDPQNTYVVSELSNISFSDGNILFNKSNGDMENYPITNLRYLSFSDYTTDISDTKLLGNNAPIVLYPNPVNNILNIKLPETNNAIITIELFSATGSKVYKNTASYQPEPYVINTSHLQNGFYLCKVNNGKTIETRTFIKN